MNESETCEAKQYNPTKYTWNTPRIIATLFMACAITCIVVSVITRNYGAKVAGEVRDKVEFSYKNSKTFNDVIDSCTFLRDNFTTKYDVNKSLGEDEYETTMYDIIKFKDTSIYHAYLSLPVPSTAISDILTWERPIDLGRIKETYHVGWEMASLIEKVSYYYLFKDRLPSIVENAIHEHYGKQADTEGFISILLFIFAIGLYFWGRPKKVLANS